MKARFRPASRDSGGGRKNGTTSEWAVNAPSIRPPGLTNGSAGGPFATIMP
jgi:hypothetical protein